jgi:Subtilisin-like serine proteases
VLATHPELRGRVRLGYDAFPGEEHICNAHGTAVAGAAAGTTLGVAPDAEVVDVKMVECRTMRGSIDAIVKGTRWMLADHALHPERRAIANWSFMADTANPIAALDSAVAQLNAVGIPVVVSAGNYEMNACHISPSNSPGAMWWVLRACGALVRGQARHSSTNALPVPHSDPASTSSRRAIRYCCRAWMDNTRRFSSSGRVRRWRPAT